jgi:hypothetical protein
MRSRFKDHPFNRFALRKTIASQIFDVRRNPHFPQLPEISLDRNASEVQNETPIDSEMWISGGN